MTSKHTALTRQKTIVKILKSLHNGGSFEEAKRMFNEEFESVDVAEITAAERQLIANGLNPMEIQNLCNVHAEVFKGSITDQQATPAFETPGHPVKTMKLENTIISSLINDELLPCLKKWQQDGNNSEYLGRIKKALADLATIDRHYTRKENTLFPIMDKYGITAPPKVMWGVDDKIRGLISKAQKLVNQDPLPDKYAIEAAIENATQEVMAMIFKEEAIMIPMIDEVATPKDWQIVREDEDQIGYTLISQPLPWKPTAEELAAAPKKDQSKLAKELNEMAMQLAADDHQVNQQVTSNSNERAPLPETTLPEDEPFEIQPGSLNLTQLIAIFKTLPFDLTFVDHTDHVRWFSDTDHRIFPRTASVIGRAVVNCHPPKSVDKVEKILKDFHAGTRNKAEFWFELHQKRFIHIEYYALHDETGKYLGCLEVSQDLTKLRKLKGEKRL